ncbi:response regulator transcription factor [Gluconacetobacter azotocaptans]|uniref:Response regulator transcription factor n=1 Tax=Gluconacetobacter azotocaptans TaxID=142834 RepID=A0A7W4PEG7_9PROT|nr:response regulator [Gluconacetobacter azotocaptans]MBB2190738.1 response regulator transcription factor [Gluconacetobacter azotocaptans]MBM9400866.1 response regulator transcription factor [Gluconacetobacter azotocaptans]GBQ31512.1 response regulator [Gluconacetobacter azotocaptans DSM 13594]
MTIAPLLLVEDEFLIRTALADYLRLRGGFTVIESETAPDALAALEGQDDIAILLTDLRLPGGLDGLEIAAQARRKWPELPVIYISGRVMAPGGSTLEGKRDSYIAKPYEPSAVLERIRSILGQD